MNVKKARVDSIEDLEALPEGQWVEVPGGINVEFDYGRFEPEGKALRIRLPRGVARRLKAKPGARWRARISGDDLILEEAP